MTSLHKELGIEAINQLLQNQCKVSPAFLAYDDQSKVIHFHTGSGVDGHVAPICGHPFLWETITPSFGVPLVLSTTGLTFSSLNQGWASHLIIPWHSMSGLRWLYEAKVFLWRLVFGKEGMLSSFVHKPQGHAVRATNGHLTDRGESLLENKTNSERQAQPRDGVAYEQHSNDAVWALNAAHLKSESP